MMYTACLKLIQNIFLVLTNPYRHPPLDCSHRVKCQEYFIFFSLFLFDKGRVQLKILVVFTTKTGGGDPANY